MSLNFANKMWVDEIKDWVNKKYCITFSENKSFHRKIDYGSDLITKYEIIF